VNLGSKKDLRVSRVGLRWSRNAFFSLPIEVLFPKLTINVTGEREREQAHLESAVQQRVVCCVREGWIAPKKKKIYWFSSNWIIKSIDSLFFLGAIHSSRTQHTTLCCTALSKCARSPSFFFINGKFWEENFYGKRKEGFTRASS